MTLRCVLLMAPVLQICHLHMFNCKHPSISPGISGPVLRLNVKPACKWSQGQDSYWRSSWAKPVVCFHPDYAVFCVRWYRWWLLVWTEGCFISVCTPGCCLHPCSRLCSAAGISFIHQVFLVVQTYLDTSPFHFLSCLFQLLRVLQITWDGFLFEIW